MQQQYATADSKLSALKCHTLAVLGRQGFMEQEAASTDWHCRDQPHDCTLTQYMSHDKLFAALDLERSEQASDECNKHLRCSAGRDK